MEQSEISEMRVLVIHKLKVQTKKNSSNVITSLQSGGSDGWEGLSPSI